MTNDEAPSGTLTTAAASGSRLRALRALRDRLAADLDETDSKRDVASLSQRLMDVLAQIDELGGGVKDEAPTTGLTRFEEKLREREAASGSRRAR